MKKPWGPRHATLPDLGLRSHAGRAIYLAAAALILLPLTIGCSLPGPSEDSTATSPVDQTKLVTKLAPTTSTSGTESGDLSIMATTTTVTDSVTLPVTTTDTVPDSGTTTTTLPGTTMTSLPPETTTTTLPSDLTGTIVPPTSTLLYEITDWSSGLNGWAAAGQWKTIAGMLVTDGTDHSIAVAPVSLGQQRNYAVECEVQFVDPGGDTAVYLVTRMINGVGYWGGHNAQDGVNAIGYADSRIAGAYFTIDGEWHKYRLEVYDNTMKLFFEDAEVVRAMDNRAIEAGTVGIYCGGGQVNVRAFRVIAL